MTMFTYHWTLFNMSSSKQIGLIVEYQIWPKGTFLLHPAYPPVKPRKVRNDSPAPWNCYAFPANHPSTPVAPSLWTQRPVLVFTKPSHPSIPVCYLNNCTRTYIIVYNQQTRYQYHTQHVNTNSSIKMKMLHVALYLALNNAGECWDQIVVILF
jgi:hypothetical protein